jgi:hypothetical protein
MNWREDLTELRLRLFSRGREHICSQTDEVAENGVRLPRAESASVTFYSEVLAIFLADVFASVILALSYGAIIWFLRATDVTVGYSWKRQGAQFHPSFDLRNRSSSKSYWLANIAYTRNRGKEVVWFDNKSVWGKELQPGTITFLDDVAPVANLSSTKECTGLEVTIRLQNGREFWLKGQGPGQLQMGMAQRIAFWLRAKLESAAIPLE